MTADALPAYSLVPSGRRSQASIAWLFVAPLLIGLFLFLLLPSLGVVVLSFSDWKLGEKNIDFYGLANYMELFSDPVFWNSATNTALYCLFVTPISVALGVWLAVLIESSRLGRVFSAQPAFCQWCPRRSPWRSFGNSFFIRHLAR